MTIEGAHGDLETLMMVRIAGRARSGEFTDAELGLAIATARIGKA
jgi:hypothetical protein